MKPKSKRSQSPGVRTLDLEGKKDSGGPKKCAMQISTDPHLNNNNIRSPSSPL